MYMEKSTAFSEFLTFMEDRRILTAEAAKRARNAYGSTDHPADTVLIELGLTRETDLAQHFSSFLNLPVMDRIPDEFETSLIRAVGLSFLEANHVLPLSLSEDRLTIGVADPFSRAAVDVLSYQFDREPELRIFPRSAIVDKIRLLRLTSLEAVESVSSDAAVDDIDTDDSSGCGISRVRRRSSVSFLR